MDTKQKPKLKLTGKDGNAFAIMGECSRAAKKAKFPPEKIKKMMNEMMSGNYNNLLSVACEYFDVR